MRSTSQQFVEKPVTNMVAIQSLLNGGGQTMQPRIPARASTIDHSDSLRNQSSESLRRNNNQQNQSLDMDRAKIIVKNQINIINNSSNGQT